MSGDSIAATNGLCGNPETASVLALIYIHADRVRKAGVG